MTRDDFGRPPAVDHADIDKWLDDTLIFFDRLISNGEKAGCVQFSARPKAKRVGNHIGLLFSIKDDDNFNYEHIVEDAEGYADGKNLTWGWKWSPQPLNDDQEEEFVRNGNISQD